MAELEGRFQLLSRQAPEGGGAQQETASPSPRRHR
jgi:hypothetical protein